MKNGGKKSVAFIILFSVCLSDVLFLDRVFVEFHLIAFSVCSNSVAFI